MHSTTNEPESTQPRTHASPETVRISEPATAPLRGGRTLILPKGWTHAPIDTTGGADDLVTVVTAPGGTLGKEIFFDPVKGWGKRHIPNSGSFQALTCRAPTAEVLATHIRNLTPSQALVMGFVPGLSRFEFRSVGDLGAALGIRGGEEPIGAFTAPDGQTLVARIKENLRPSSWRLIDVDVNDHMPAEWRAWTREQWLEAIDNLEPEAGFAGCAKVILSSSSSRVTGTDGKPVLSSSGSFHTFIQTEPGWSREWAPDLMIRGILRGYSYSKPIKGNTRGRLSTLIDHVAAMGSNRLSFDGPPSLDISAMLEGAGVDAFVDAVVEVQDGGRFDVDKVPPTTSEEHAEYMKLSGAGVRIKANGSGSSVEFMEKGALAADYTFNTEHGAMTWEDLRDAPAHYDKIRVQADWRGSDSWNAYAARGRPSGAPVAVFDNGMSTWHLPPEDWIAEYEFGDGPPCEAPPMPAIPKGLSDLISPEDRERVLTDHRMDGDAWPILRREFKTKYHVNFPDLDQWRKRLVAPPPRDPEADDATSDFFAYLPEHKYIYRPTRALWTRGGVDGHFGDAKAETPTGDWLDQNRPIHQLVWTPNHAETVEGRVVGEGGWIGHERSNCYNLYRPPLDNWKSGDAAQAKLWIDHLKKVYPDGWEHLRDWLAFKIQNPGEKINHAIVLGGMQGIGKDTLLEPIKHGVGPWNFSEIAPADTIGKFNGWVRNVVVRVSEARDLGDVDRYSLYDHMKTVTAAPPDVLRVNEKNIRECSVFNVIGVIYTSNHKTDGLYLPADDRRHFVVWSDLSKDDFSDEYWSEIWDWYLGGGIDDVIAYLRSLDLSGFKPKAPPRKTDAFHAIVHANHDPAELELGDVLEALGHPVVLMTDDIYGAAKNMNLESVITAFGDRRVRRAIPHQMHRAGYEPFRNSGAADGRWKMAGKNYTLYAKKISSVKERHDEQKKISSRLEKVLAELQRRKKEEKEEADRKNQPKPSK